MQAIDETHAFVCTIWLSTGIGMYRCGHPFKSVWFVEVNESGFTFVVQDIFRWLCRPLA